MAIKKRISIALPASLAGAIFMSVLVSLGLERRGYSTEILIATFVVLAVFGLGASMFAVRAKKRTESSGYKAIEILSVILMVLWFVFTVFVGSEATCYMASSIAVRILIIVISGLLYFSYYLLAYHSDSCPVKRQSSNADKYGIPL